MRVRIISSFNDRSIGMGGAFRPKDVVTVPDEAVAKRWIKDGLAISLEPTPSPTTITQKVKKALTPRD